MIRIKCVDKYKLEGDLFYSRLDNKKNKILIINSATGVSRKMYKNYAVFMAANGIDTLIYDYRGIAGSRPKNLRKFNASFSDWGEKDFDSVIDFVKMEFPSHKILVLGHSIGGTIIGMSEKCALISGIVNIGAQTSYYKDWNEQRVKMYLLWHVIFPLVTSIFGYFPGKRLNMLEDIPKGVVRQWDSRKKEPNMVKQLDEIGQNVFYDLFKGKLLTLAIEDDIIGTPIAIERVTKLFVNAQRKMELIKPESFGAEKIGHFGFFSRKFESTLWKKTLNWFEEV